MRTTPIGLLFSTTGPYDIVGRAMRNGAMLAVEQIAEEGMVRLRPVEADPGGVLARYPAPCRAMLGDGIRHVVGCYTSSSRKELVPLFEKHDALLWYPSHYEGFETSSNVVYNGAAPNQHIVPLIEHVLRQAGRRIFCVGSNYIWAWENNRILRDVLLPRGGMVLGERYVPVGETDFDQLIDIILEARPDFIFETLIGSSAYRFFAAFRAACEARGIDQKQAMPLLSCSLSEPELLAIDERARDGHISSSVYFSSVETAENRRFIKAYEARFPEGPVVCADAEASYVAVRLMAASLADAGTDEPAAVLAAAGRQSLRAPQGEIRLDPQTMHAFLTPRIGRSRADGRFDIIHQAPAPVAPDPYLTRTASRLEAIGPPRLRIVS